MNKTDLVIKIYDAWAHGTGDLDYYINKYNYIIDALHDPEENILKDHVEELTKRISKAKEFIKSYNIPTDSSIMSESPVTIGELTILLSILEGDLHDE